MTEDELHRARTLQHTINAYRRVFGPHGEPTPDGRIILDDLAEAFGTRMPAFLPLDGKPAVYDSHYAAIRDGQRSVTLHIEARTRAAAKGDANLEKTTKRKIKS